MADIRVVGFPVSQVAEKEMMLSPFGFAQRDQILWVKLQIWGEVKRFDMVDLYPLALVTTGHTGWLAQKMLFCDPRPVGASFAPMSPCYSRSMIPFP